jgi:hypothetical protein
VRTGSGLCAGVHPIRCALRNFDLQIACGSVSRERACCATATAAATCTRAVVCESAALCGLRRVGRAWRRDSTVQRQIGHLLDWYRSTYNGFVDNRERHGRGKCAWAEQSGASVMGSLHGTDQMQPRPRDGRTAHARKPADATALTRTDRTAQLIAFGRQRLARPGHRGGNTQQPRADAREALAQRCCTVRIWLAALACAHSLHMHM